MNCASFPSFRRSIGESLIEGNVHLNQHGLESWHLPQELVAKNKEEAFAYSSSLFVLDFRLYCDFSCILLGFLQVQDDEEEGFKEKRGVTLTSVCQSSWVRLPTHTVIPARGIICRCLTCGSYVRPLYGPTSHSMLCLAPINTTSRLLSLCSVAWWQLLVFSSPLRRSNQVGV